MNRALEMLAADIENGRQPDFEKLLQLQVLDAAIAGEQFMREHLEAITAADQLHLESLTNEQ